MNNSYNIQMVIFSLIMFILISMNEVSAFTVNETEVTVSPFPVFAYTPDTSFMFGGAGALFFRPSGEPEAVADNIQFIGFYTVKNQYNLTLSYKKNLLNNKFVNRGSFSYKFWPSEFYGIGPNTREEDEEKYEARDIPLEQAWLYEVLPNFYTGFTYKFQYYKITKTEDRAVLSEKSIPGTKKTYISAPGLRIAYDSRDNDLYTSSGLYTALSSYQNSNSFSATQNYSNISFEHKQFFQTLSPDYIYGYHIVAVNQSGDVPISAMETIGGSDVLRGFNESRYIDKSKYSVQNEFRFPVPFIGNTVIGEKLSAAVFAGFANIAPSVSEFKNETIRSAVGGGIRYALNKKEKLNLRLDIAYSSDQNVKFHILAMEAF